MFHFIINTVGSTSQATKTFKFATREEGHDFMCKFNLANRVIDVLFQ